MAPNGYEILGGPDEGGGTVLSIGSAPMTQNLFVGIDTGVEQQWGAGINHTFLGYRLALPIRAALYNTFLGHNAGINNTTGSYNVFVGAGAGPQNVIAS